MKKQYPYNNPHQPYSITPNNQLDSFQEFSSSNQFNWTPIQYSLSILGISLMGGFLMGLLYSLFLGLNQGITLGLIHGMISGSIWAFIWLSKWSKHI